MTSGLTTQTRDLKLVSCICFTVSQQTQHLVPKLNRIFQKKESKQFMPSGQLLSSMKLEKEKKGMLSCY